MNIEERGAFEREQRRHPVQFAIVNGEARLQAGDIRRGAEARRRAAQLARFGQVFRVEYGDERPARERHRDVEGARLGARNAFRRNHDLMRRSGRMRPQRRRRRFVVGFDDEFHVELCARIIPVLSS